MIDADQAIATRTLKRWLFDDNKMLQPSAEQIHVLAVASEKLKWESSPLGPHIYDSESQYFWLEKEDTAATGLLPKRLMLYCRPNFHKQIEFLRERVLKDGHLGWVLGPPGTGKSATAMAFALTVDRSEWEVIWIHVAMEDDWQCVRLIGDERTSRIVTDVTELKEVLNDNDDFKHRIVLIDGWTAADDFKKLSKVCKTLFSKEDVIMKRRLAFICSIASRRKVKDDRDVIDRAMECPVFSWTLDEYIDAIKDDTFFRNVEPYLGDPLSDRSAMVEAKYYYAGGSCRYMFCYNSTEVMIKLRRAVCALNNAEDTATIGMYLQLCINRLFAMFRVSDVKEVTPLISRYAAMVIAEKCGPNTIRNFMSTIRQSSNPALNGWMVEVTFFPCIQHGGLAIFDADGNKLETWSQSLVVESDEIPQLPDGPVWIKPSKWNQGGYDAIMVCKKTAFVRMVQVTSADKHSFHIGSFHSWLKKLQQSIQSFEIKTLEITFVVAREKLKSFELTDVTGQGLLEAFKWLPAMFLMKAPTVSGMCATKEQMNTDAVVEIQSSRVN
ncbi:hypothetical protein DD238_001152 [Peronospora effusa]|uniref:Uncharacterized protein n=1 Tax=Peronospora effusa TaxID=542832 RepID=A0A3M6VKT6_9STRA|nr:hypothetical protein DD238_001152 [Peronospora effusa]